MRLALLEPKTSPFNNSPQDKLSPIELQVLGSSNAKRINNLPVDVEAVPPMVKD